mmetsp:Transcript_51366/g.111664  ORF Transcript_51366/g.111664 Transcript_51366/m.111664 type:complete len:242 (+) Transcript_51366:507-1232(+)
MPPNLRTMPLALQRTASTCRKWMGTTWPPLLSPSTRPRPTRTASPSSSSARRRSRGAFPRSPGPTRDTAKAATSLQTRRGSVSVSPRHLSSSPRRHAPSLPSAQPTAKPSLKRGRRRTLRGPRPTPPTPLSSPANVPTPRPSSPPSPRSTPTKPLPRARPDRLSFNRSRLSCLSSPRALPTFTAPPSTILLPLATSPAPPRKVVTSALVSESTRWAQSLTAWPIMVSSVHLARPLPPSATT